MTRQPIPEGGGRWQGALILALVLAPIAVVVFFKYIVVAIFFALVGDVVPK